MSKRTELIKSHLYCNGYMGVVDKLFEDKDGVHLRVITDWDGHTRLKTLMGKIGYEQVDLEAEPSDMDFFRATHHYHKEEPQDIE